MLVAATARQGLRPDRVGTERGRTRGVRRKLLGFKADEAAVEYISQEARTKGWNVTTVLHDMVTTQIDLEKALGVRWWEIEARAVAERTTKGSILAELVLAALRSHKR